MAPLFHVARTLSLLVAVMSAALAQVPVAWVDVYAPAAWTRATTDYVLPVPGGGTLTGSTGELVNIDSAGEAVIRRLTENGDVAWEAVQSLPPADYIAYPYRHYLAGLAVGASGEVAVAIGSPGPMRIEVYEPNGTLRWTTTVSVVVGPHFEESSVALAPNGDVLFASNERLFADIVTERFGLYRLAAADGSILWSQGAPSNGFIRMAVDSLGNAHLAVNRRSTGIDTLALERFDPAGVRTGLLLFGGSGNPFSVSTIQPGAAGRVIVGLRDLQTRRVLSIDESMNVEWDFDLGTSYHAIGLMADGELALQSASMLTRLDRQGAVVSRTPASMSGLITVGAVSGRPNGNSVSATADLGPPHALLVEERDRGGAIIKSRETAVAWGNGLTGLAVDARGNVHAAYSLPDGFSRLDSGVFKLLFEDRVGIPYCGPAVPNSTGRSATVRAVGGLGAVENNLSLLFADLPFGSTVLPIASQVTGLVMQPGGSEGTLCLGGSIGRFDEPGEIRIAGPGGMASLQVELRQMPTPGGLVTAVAGETWNFQAWYRDVGVFPVATSNFTDAVAVTLR